MAFAGEFDLVGHTSPDRGTQAVRPPIDELPPVLDGDWRITQVVATQRTMPAGIFQTDTVSRRVNSRTGEVVIEVQSVAFFRGGTRFESSRKLTELEFVDRLIR